MYYHPLPYLDYVKTGKKKYYRVAEPLPVPVKTKSFWQRLMGQSQLQATPQLVSISPEKAEKIQHYNDAVRIFNRQPNFGIQAAQLQMYQKKVYQLAQIEQRMLHLTTTVSRMDEQMQVSHYLKQFLIIEGDLGISKYKMALLHQNYIYNAAQVSDHRKWPKGIGHKLYLPLHEWRKELLKTFVYVPNEAYQLKAKAKLLQKHPEIRRKRRKAIAECAQNIVKLGKRLQASSRAFDQANAAFRIA